MGVSKNKGTQNGWFIMEIPIKVDDLGGTPIFGNTHMYRDYAIYFSITVPLPERNRKSSNMPMTDLWDERYIYLHGWLIFMVFM